MASMAYKSLLFLLFTAISQAAVPTITNIVLLCQDITTGQEAACTTPSSTANHSSVRLTFDVNPAASWVSFKVGTVSGVYTAQPQGKMYQANHDDQSANLCSGGTCHVALAINALVDATVYYILPTAQPSDMNTTDQCAVAGCGAVEQVYATGSATVPVAPTAPTAYEPVNPNTSAYTIVQMNNGGAGGQCRAATITGSNPGSVSAGDLLQSMIDKAAGAAGSYVFEGVAAQACKASDTSYVLTHFSTGTCAAWIVFRTHVTTSTDFMPVGVGINPTTAANNWVLEKDNFAQPIFITDSGGSGSECYRFENVTMGPSASATGPLFATAKFGAGSLEHNSDQIVLEHVYFRGRVDLDTYWTIELAMARFAFLDSYMDNAHSTFFDTNGFYMQTTGTGPYNFRNSRFQNVIGETLYNEVSNGNPPAANDVTIQRNRLYIDVTTALANVWYMRQDVEFKCCHRNSIKGNIFDGTFADGNEGSAIYIAGTNDFIQHTGVSDILIKSNMITNTASLWTCQGTRAGANNPGADNPVTQRMWAENNLSWNTGLTGRLGSVRGGTGVVSRYWTNTTGCVDMTFVNNTAGAINPYDSRPGTMVGFRPAIFVGGGGGVFTTGQTFRRNIFYLSTDFNDQNRIFINDGTIPDSQTSASTRTPTPLITGTPAAKWATFAIKTTNSGLTSGADWGGNIGIPWLTSAATNVFTDMDATQAAAAASDMPSGDTYGAGANLAAREANVGYDPTPFSWACTGACATAGAGVTLSTLYNDAGIVRGVTVTPAFTTATIGYTAPDATACYVDIATNSGFTAGLTRTADAGGVAARSVTITGLTPSTTYYRRILCVFEQVNSGVDAMSFTWPTSMVTSGSFATNAIAGFSLQYSGTVFRRGTVSR